jgi:D-alanyl-D-alanine carboxypeptidase (penicillin-binding protein 5/6)
MLLPSGNDAAEAIAGSDPHGHPGFIRAMNAWARRLGATDTHVVTPSGLTAAGAHSSARDLLVFLRAAQANRVVEPFLRKASGRVGPLHGRSHLVYRRTDYVNSYPIAQGKSGYTTPALNTLVVATPMRSPGGAVHRIGVATLGAPSGYSTKGTRALTVWAARNYQHLRPVGQLPAAPGPVVGAQAGLATGD